MPFPALSVAFANFTNAGVDVLHIRAVQFQVIAAENVLSLIISCDEKLIGNQEIGGGVVGTELRRKCTGKLIN